MIETLKRWNEERKLTPYERFVLRAGRRIDENRKRVLEGKSPKGWVIMSAEPLRYAFTDRPLPQSIEVEEKPSTEAQSWAESFRRIESPEGSSCFEQIDFSGEILGRIWVSSSAVIEFTEK